MESFFGKDAKIRGRDLVVDNEAGRKYLHDPLNEHEIRVLPKGITFESDIIVFGESVVFFAYDEDRTVVRMDNQQLADTMRSWLEVMWSASRTKAKMEK